LRNVVLLQLVLFCTAVGVMYQMLCGTMDSFLEYVFHL